MRFAGFTEISRANAVARSLKDSLVFGNRHEINHLKNEWVIAWTGKSYARLSSASMIDVYFRTISDEKQELNWKSLLGVTTTTFKLNSEKLKNLIAESEPYINEQVQYLRTRWHDVVVLLLLQKVTEPTSELNRYATYHLRSLASLNSQLSDIYANFKVPIFS